MRASTRASLLFVLATLAQRWQATSYGWKFPPLVARPSDQDSVAWIVPLLSFWMNIRSHCERHRLTKQGAGTWCFQTVPDELQRKPTGVLDDPESDGTVDVPIFPSRKFRLLGQKFWQNTRPFNIQIANSTTLNSQSGGVRSTQSRENTVCAMVVKASPMARTVEAENTSPRRPAKRSPVEYAIMKSVSRAASVEVGKAPGRASWSAWERTMLPATLVSL
ncbi:hypothetical protein FOL46_002932 [Perkinsus olseni]|uniref:Secreted protein n=1 Tax=Perkinsus olseni TaxID=32597 RepID=A0A7J6MYA3_PEROL|nr:hypothetical protein FOL46_002932 [Perkinsus olseni]